jgi:hypothetical protein
MKRSNIVGWAALHALVASGYVMLVVNLIQIIVPNGPDGTLRVAGFLLLFCLSAAIMASLVFGRPVMWYLNGQKKEAVELVAWTIFFLFVATITVLYLSSFIDPRVPEVLPV